MKDYMSGDELYRYLHISKRKMKYLLENGYIPMTDTGMKTHRYRVEYEDARAFKRRMKTEPGCLSELTGMFNTSGPRKRETAERLGSTLCSGVGGTAGRASGTAGGQADWCAAAANPQACPRGKAARRHHNGQTILR